MKPWYSALRRFGGNALLAIAAGLMLLGPDLILSIQHPSFRPLSDWRVPLAAVGLGWLLLNARPKALGLVLFALLSLIQLSELLHLHFFGVFYGPSEVFLLSSDYKEIADSVAGLPAFFALPFLVWSASFVGGWLLLRRTRRWQFSSFIVSGLLVLALINPAQVALRHEGSARLEPDSDRLALHNGLNAISFFLVKDAPAHTNRDRALPTYEKYGVERIAPPMPYHVVLYMGESLAPSHMSLFGYERPTTPFLESLAREAGSAYGIIASGAVTTRVSIPTFINVQYAPDDYGHLSDKSTNLYRLAKEAGMQTALLSTQALDGISSAVARNDIDVWEDYFSVNKRFPDTYDMRLVSLLETTPIDWSRPAFIVLNPRSTHSPYQEDVPPQLRRWSGETPKRDVPRYMTDSYDDAMHYADETLAGIVAALQRLSPLPVAFVLVSDHGQRLGELGGYGHNTLDYTTSATPFLLATLNSKVPIVPAAPPFGECIRNHYGAAKLVARLLGYGIRNPNEIPGKYFLNGNDLLGRAGYLAYTPEELPARYRCVELPPAQAVNSVKR